MTEVIKTMKKSTPCREAQILRERRTAMGLTQHQVAAEVGIELQQYQRYEYGSAILSHARMRIGLRICATLELDPYETIFVDEEDFIGWGS